MPAAASSLPTFVKLTSLIPDNAVSLGDRHHRPDPMGKLRHQPLHATARIRLRISPSLAQSRVGQLGAWLCVNLLARLEGLLAEVELDCPEVPVHPLVKVPRLRAPVAAHLPQWLAEVAASASGSRLKLTLGKAESALEPILELIIGGGEVDAGLASRHIWCFGRGWIASVGARPTVPRAQILDESNPLGMYLAVCYGVGEVFKTLKGSGGGESLSIDLIYSSLWSGQSNTDSWNMLEDGPRVSDVLVVPTYLVGAGAVGQAALLALLTSTRGAQFLTPVDGDGLGLTNRNRYILTFEGDENLNKALFTATLANEFNTPAHGEPLNWVQYLGRHTAHPDAHLAANEAELRYALVLSCVDKNRPRHEIQRTWPGDILGASTESLRAQAVHYDLRTFTACLACHNPIPAFDQVLDGLRRELEPLSTEQRTELLLSRGIESRDIESALRYLENPNCGELGETVLKKFADDGAPAFAVGFVSVAAGLLLARHWIRYALYGSTGVTPGNRHYLTINFFNGRFLWHEEAARDSCHCLDGGRERWRALWNSGG
jgi:molybdopterin/thiamine biosynthesis adenylyltransferase